MTTSRKLGITALVLWTLTVTVLRGLGAPNDFAKAHWLLDYRFGFVKRGLVGEILSLATGRMSMPITERLIITLSGAAFLVYCSVIIVLSIRTVHKSGWSTGAVLVSLAFLSSPFVVMSAHLVGYYDNIIIVLGVFSIVLLFSGRAWPAACLQVLAILVHENSLLLVLPLFSLAWLLINSRRQQSGVRSLPFLPLLLPVLAFLIIAASQAMFLAKDFVQLFSVRLSQFSFIQANWSADVPVWISTSFVDYYASQKGALLQRLFSVEMYGLVLPSALAILCFAVSAFRILDVSAESLALLCACFAPQIMHVVAWDTPRIWTYTILCSFLALWIYSELFIANEGSSAIRLLCLVALVVNTLILTPTPIMDRQIDLMSLRTRLLLYAPVIVGSLTLVFSSERVSITERLSIQGRSIVGIVRPTMRCRSTSGSATRSKPEAPER